MKKYLIVYRPRYTTYTNYDLSSSRNAIKHMEELNAQTVWVYDKNGWWVSFADRDSSGKPYRPKMFPDGEPRRYYAEMYERLKIMADYFDGKSSFL